MKKNSSLNHAYRLVWNEQTGAYVAVSEHTKGRGKRASGALLATALLGLAGQALALDPGALPGGGTVAAGQAGLAQHGNQLTVTQQGQKLILNWQDFNIGSNASVRFDQPGRDAIALNRVIGGDASSIQGSLQSNGQVWLVNPNGVVFGKTAQVNVGGLVASSLNVSDADFLAGRANFSGGGAGAVRNEGALRAQGGVVALLAPQVANLGSIAAGGVALGAGEAVSLDFTGDGLIKLNVQRAALDALVDNQGRIEAGAVVLSARSANAVRASVVNNEGVIEARGLSLQGGRILLDGGESGEVHVAGRLDASSDTGRGGRIEITGQQLRLDGGAQLDASGAAGGGVIHIGGGYQGKDAALRNATRIAADASVTARANATQSGQGGEVVFWSDDSTQFAGRIEVRGGAQGGNGGRAEVSGKQLDYSGRTDARAAKGRTGDLLLDPDSLEIRGGGTGSGGLTGNVVYELDLEAQSANIVLEATHDVTFKDLHATGSSDGVLALQDGVSLTVTAGRGGEGRNDPGDKVGVIRFEQKNDEIRVQGAAGIFLNASNWNSSAADEVNGGSGSVINIPKLVAAGAGSNPSGALPNYDLKLANPGAVDPGSITVFGANGITVGGSIQTNGGYVRLWADSDTGTGGSFKLAAPVTTNGGNLYLASGNGGIDMLSSITLGAGRLQFDNENYRYTGGVFGGAPPNAEKRLSGVINVTGDVQVDTAMTMNAGASILTDGVIRLNSAVNLNTGVGVLTLRGSAIDFSNATLQNLSTASMRLEPADKATNMEMGGATGFASAATLAKLPGIKNLTVGREDGTGTITVPGNFTFDASGSFEMVNKNLDISGGSLINTGGNITLTGDNISIAQYVNAHGGAGTVTVRQMTAANSLHLGGGLNNASVGNIQAATLAVGRVDGGDLVFDSDITTSASNVHLMSGQRVEGIHGGVAAANLAITAGTGAEITNGNFNFSTVALKVGGDTLIAPARNGNFGLGTVDGVAGLQVDAGTAPTVTLLARGEIGANAPINFNNTAATLNLRGDTLDSSGTVLSGQGVATVSFDARSGNSLVHFGGNPGGADQAGLAVFNGVKKLVLGSNANDLSSVGDLALAVGELEIRGRSLQADHAITNQGNIHLHAEANDLALQGAMTATGTLVLSTGGGKAITAAATLTAAKLAVHTTGNATLDQATHQVGQLAGEAAEIRFKNGKSLAIGSVDGSVGVTASRSVDIRADGAASDLVLNQAVTANNAGGAATPLLLAAGRYFVNNQGASALSASGGRWLVYSTDPRQDTRGSLANAFKQYNASLADTVLGSGNGFLYTVAPQLTVGLVGSVGKVYDGNTTATLGSSNYQSSGAIDGDVVAYAVGGSTAYADKDVGIGKTVSVSGLALGAASQGAVTVYGYRLANTSASGAIGRITPRSVGAAAGAVADKVYDGSTQASLGAVGISGLLAGDDVRVGGSGTASFADKNAGANKRVTISGLTLSGADAANYQFDGQAQASITPRDLGVSAHVADKTYDGGTAATLQSLSLQGVIGGDAVSVDGHARFSDKNAGAGKAVDLGLSLGGADAGNYRVGRIDGAQASITPKALQLGAVQAASKTYDGTLVASLGGGEVLGLIAGDQVGVQLKGEFTDKNVGQGKAVSVQAGLSGADAGNYSLPSTAASVQADITPKLLSAADLQGITKVYDGTRDAQVSGSLGGVLGGDRVDLQVSAQFDTRNVGHAKDVAVSLALGGAEAGNYQLAQAQATVKGDITPRQLGTGDLSVAAKVYDGTRAADVGGGALQGLLAGDQVGVALHGEFSDKNAGLGKDVQVQLALSGGDAGNYQLAQTSRTAKGDITLRQLGAGELGVAGKVYDGTRHADVSGGVLQGLLAGDQVGVALHGEFSDKNAGLGKDVQVQLALSGSDAGNYQLAQSIRTAQGDITPKELGMGSPQVLDKTYDGSAEARLNAQPRLDGLVAGDQVQARADARFDNAVAGQHKPVAITVSLSGADAGNYRLASSELQASGTILPVPGGDAVNALQSAAKGGNSTQASGASSLPAVGGGAQRGADPVGGRPAATSAPAFSGEQVLSNGTQFSLAQEGAALERVLTSVLPVFQEQGTAPLVPLGLYQVRDQGDSLALLPQDGAQSGLPKLDQAVSFRAEAMLDLGQGDTVSLNLELLSDGTLRALLPQRAAALGNEAISAFSLSTLKARAGVAMDGVRALVLRFDAPR